MADRSERCEGGQDADPVGDACGGIVPVVIDTVAQLVERLAPLVTSSTVIVYVGNDLRGDDAAGPMIALGLLDAVPWRVFDARNAPESFLGKIVDCKPDTVVLIDALDFDAHAGAIALFDARLAEGHGPSTHGPAPVAFLDALAMMHPASMWILGIQAERVAIGDEPCASVRNAVATVVEAFRTLAEPDRGEGEGMGRQVRRQDGRDPEGRR